MEMVFRGFEAFVRDIESGMLRGMGLEKIQSMKG
jgi:hypothetical protein